MEKVSVVAIVGRQNVGKSSLMNAIAGRRLSIVDPKPGVTRDRVSAIVSYRGVPFELVDTGGIGLDRRDELFSLVDRQIQYAIDRADIVIFLGDIRQGLLPLDAAVGERLRVAGKKVILAVNKADHPREEEGKSDFYRLGFGEALPVSAVHRRRIGTLLERIAELLPNFAEAARAVPDIKIAIVGRRNVGKSTLVNMLAGEERVIVSEKPGTTRDTIDVMLERDGRRTIVIDTAGLRKKTHVEDSIELFSRARTEKAITRADAVVLLLDARERVGDVDLKIARFIENEKKPCILGLNKWDLVPRGHAPMEFMEYLSKAMPGLSYAPVCVLSAKTGLHVWDLLEIACELVEQAGVKIPTSEVNRVLKAVVREQSPPTRGTRTPKIYYGTQVAARPPRFSLFVADPKAFAPEWMRFLENRFREYLPFKEVPLVFQLRARRKRR